MPALYVMIPAALLLVGVAVYIFFWAVDSGQYDDLDSPAALAALDDWADLALAEGGDDPGAPGRVGRTLDALLGLRI